MTKYPRSVVFALRSLIHEAEARARSDRDFVSGLYPETPDQIVARVNELDSIETEIDLAAVAAVCVWDVEKPKALRKLWNAIGRASKITPNRWIKVIGAIESLTRSIPEKKIEKVLTPIAA